MTNSKNYIFVSNSEQCKRFKYVSELEEYAKEQNIQIYILSAPLVDNKYSSSYDNGLIIASPGYKIMFVSKDNNKEGDDFQNYIDDTLEDIGSISDRYNFKEKIGRPRQWRNNLIVSVNINDFDKSLDLSRYKISSASEVRRVNIIISFLIGSINSAVDLEVEAPDNILDSVKQKIQLFDCDQTRFIYDEVPKERKTIRIQGLSGTGKTELLLHKLKDVYISSKSDVVAFTCYSRVLAHSLRKRIFEFFNNMNVQQQIAWDERLFCFNSWGQQYDPNSGLYSYICDKYDLNFQAYKYNPIFEKVCEKACNEIKSKREKSGTKEEYAFQYLFLDESQDFGPKFFELCELVTEHRVFVAGDIFQDIYATLDEGENIERDYLLSRCYRTDPKLFMIAQGLGWGLFEQEKLRWLSDSAWNLCGYSIEKENNIYKLTREHLRRFDNFQDPGTCFCTSFAETIYDTSKDVVAIIKKLQIEFPNLTPDDICVIYLDDSQYVYNSVPLLKQRIYSEFEWDTNVAYETKKKVDNALFVSNRRHAKGLEFPFVICITNEIKKTITYRNSLYTMLSRAFLRTYMIMPITQKTEYETKFEAGVKNVLENAFIITHKPTKEQEENMKRRLLDFKQTKPIHDRIREALLTLDLPESNIDKVFDYVRQTKKIFGDDNELKRFIKNLVEMGFIDE